MRTKAFEVLSRKGRVRHPADDLVLDGAYELPYIENKNNFILDYHVVCAGVLVYLIAKHAGHVWGLDGWAERLLFFQRYSGLRPLAA